MSEEINESVSVNLLSNHITSIFWRHRQYHITHVGLHHAVWEGRVLCHVFSVTDGNTFFKLHFNTETLFWKLIEIETNE